MSTISFLASHGGSAAKTVMTAIESGKLNAEVGIIITNNKDSEIYRWCADNDVNVFHVSGKTHPDEVSKDRYIKSLLMEANTDLIVLSGYMKKIGPETLGEYENRILNIHPSLLPAHGGKGLYGDRVHESVLSSGDKVSGATVQIINAEYDEGPILIQQEVPVLPDDTLKTLKNRVQAIEGDLYINAIRKIQKLD